ncbi:MAG: DEAD/DEAH box helicase [Verrucomicrobia bacterium]|nr:DEAD/DEAH box helicase [Verrucomicrobiota bacterium]
MPIISRLDQPPKPVAADGDGKSEARSPKLETEGHHPRGRRSRGDSRSRGGQKQPTFAGPRALVIEPTRELALQVEEAFRTFTKFSPLRVGVMYGGVGYAKQVELLQKGMDIWVGTPGRMLDFLERGELSLQHLQTVVLDEADRLLDMGFLPDVRRILEQCPPRDKRQTLLFSATIPPEIQTLVNWAMTEPEIVEIGIRRSPAETVTHALYPVANDQKYQLLHELLERTHYESVIVFCRMKSGVDLVAGSLEREGHKVIAMHSDRNQSEREEALRGFREGKYEVLVATDIAARGLDIAGVTHVINFDVPQHPEDYVHRIGRTGRAAKEGDALTLVTADEVLHVQSIERFIGRPIERKKIDNFNYTYTALFALKEGEGIDRFRVSGGRAGKGYSFSTGRRRR